MKRISNAALLASTGAVFVLVGFYVESNVDASNSWRVARGLPPESSAAPWVWGGIGVALILLAVLIWATGADKVSSATSATPPPAVPAGWYAQADGSQRWWDGSAWSEQQRP